MTPNKIISTLLVIVSTLAIVVSAQLITAKDKIAALETKQSQYQELKHIDDQIIAKANTGFGVSSQTLDACLRHDDPYIAHGASQMNTVMEQVNAAIIDRNNLLKELK